MDHWVAYLLQPFPLLLMGLAVALLVVWRDRPARRRGTIVLGLLLALLALLSTPLASFLALGTLERPYPPAEDVPTAQDTIVVLSGSLLLDDQAGLRARVGPDTFYRCLHASRLYKQAGGCRIVVSGGKVHSSTPGPTLADTMREFLIELGLRREHIVLEDQSSTTYENALHCRSILENKAAPRIFLITDAASMLRAERCFAAQGISVVAAPCHHRALRFDYSLETFLPTTDGLRGVEQASHEWLGLAWYRLRGRI